MFNAQDIMEIKRLESKLEYYSKYHVSHQLAVIKIPGGLFFIYEDGNIATGIHVDTANNLPK